jgi:parvulin-like peptidyl-prolyl isomerase
MPSKDEELAKDQPTKDAPAKKAKGEDKAAKLVKSETDKPRVEKEVKDEPQEASKPETLSEAAEELKSEKASKKSGPMAAVTSLGRGGNWKSVAVTVAAVVVALAAVIVIVFGVMIYVYKSDNAAVKAVSDVVPYPAEQVNGQFVAYSDYLFEVDANERAYQNNAKLNNQPAVNFNSSDGKKLLKQIKQHSMTTLESNALVAQLAKQWKVSVTDKDVNNLINQLYQRYGGKDTLLKTLNQIYGWDLNDLKKVVRQQLLQQKLQEKVTSDPKAAASAKAKAQDVLTKVKAGGDFGALAKQYSQASDASNGGDMGSVTKDQVPAELWAAANALQPDQVSDVVKEQYGYEIVKVVDKPDANTIHVQHILINTTNFNDYFQQQLKKAKVRQYIKTS